MNPDSNNTVCKDLKALLDKGVDMLTLQFQDFNQVILLNWAEQSHHGCDFGDFSSLQAETGHTVTISALRLLGQEACRHISGF